MRHEVRARSRFEPAILPFMRIASLVYFLRENSDRCARALAFQTVVQARHFHLWRHFVFFKGKVDGL
jgi:hypothetical protein